MATTVNMVERSGILTMSLSVPPELIKKLSDIQQSMLRVLSDGKPHKRIELHACLWDEQSRLSSIQRHISLIRKVLRPLNQDILCVYCGRMICYQHIRLLLNGQA